MKAKLIRNMLLACILVMLVTMVQIEVEANETSVYMNFGDVDENGGNDQEQEKDDEEKDREEKDDEDVVLGDVEGADTGDDTNFLIYVGVGVAATLGVLVILNTKRKKKDME